MILMVTDEGTMTRPKGLMKTKKKMTTVDEVGIVVPTMVALMTAEMRQ